MQSKHYSKRTTTKQLSHINNLDEPEVEGNQDIDALKLDINTEK